MTEKSTEALMKKAMMALQLYIDARIEEKMPKCGCNQATEEPEKPVQLTLVSPEPKKPSTTNTFNFEIMQRWNTLASEVGLSHVREITAKRKQGIARCRKAGQLDDLDLVFEALRGTFWLDGNLKENDWLPNFDWLFTRKDKVMQLLEGQFKARGSGREDGDSAPDLFTMMNLEGMVNAGSDGGALQAANEGESRTQQYDDAALAETFKIK